MPLENTTTGSNYSWIDRSVVPGKVYYYQLSETDMSGNVTVYNSLAHAELINASGSVPTQFALRQNYPNPFNPSTTFEFDVADPGFASLKIYNLLGREVATVVEGNLAAQSYRITWSGSELSTGVYFYTLKTDNFSDTKKARSDEIVI